ncbi:MAG: hypothetical protein ABI151_07280 [Chitinophagaceae bacterium]
MQKTGFYFTSIIYLVVVTSTILLFSCNKGSNSAPAVISPATSEFTLRDTLKIESQYQNGPFSDLYKRYNGKLYSVNSSNKVGFSVQRSGINSVFSFYDSSITNLRPSISIILNNTTFETLAAQYALTNSTILNIRDGQTFIDGSSAISTQTNVVSGILKIRYNNILKTVTGEINQLKFTLGYFTPEDIPPLSRSSNGILIEHGGSTRTVSLKFADVKLE